MEDDILHFPEGVLVDDVIGAGLVGIVALREDRKTVIKFAPSNTFQHFIDVERRVYERLNSGTQHDGLLKYYGSLDQGLILEYACNKSLRDYVAHHKEQPLPRRLSWAEQLAASVRFIHTKGILHGDISCNNAFLDESLKLKLGDFAGSSIDDEPPLVCYDISHEHPDLTDISIKSELFALGSSLYEIMTGSKPYQGFSASSIRNAYRANTFPDLRRLEALGNVITGCWNREYHSSDAVLAAIRSEGTELLNKIDKMFHIITNSFNLCSGKYQVCIAHPAQPPQKLSHSQPHTPCSRNLVLSMACAEWITREARFTFRVD